MMFMIGQGVRVQVIGPPQPEHCERCGGPRDFVPRLTYAFGQFDLLFGFVYDKRYELVCPVCNGGWKLDPFAAERTFGKPEIPFHLRYGIWVLAALAVAVGTAAYLYRQRGG